MKIAPTVLVALAVVLAMVLVDTCARRDERQKFEAQLRDARDDSTVAWLEQEAADSLKAFTRWRDSTGREIRRLKARLGANLSPNLLPPPTRGRDTADASVGVAPSRAVEKVAPDVRDSLIAAYDAGRQQDSLQLVFWQAQVAQRDSVISTLQASRNAWRQRAERRFSCGGGAGITVGLNGKSATGPTVACIFRF